MTPSTLRTLAQFHSGTDLQARLADAEDIIRQQREGLAWAADEIERLQAELKAARAAAPPCSVNADGHDSGTTRAP
jgi:phage terminase large subunit-like protein